MVIFLKKHLTIELAWGQVVTSVQGKDYQPDLMTF
tara:strand:+ start:387 stop:491 length:105 start_codon:yes stop_codon:yes gene_type:complete